MEVAFEKCGKGVYGKFVKYIEGEVGEIEALKGMKEEEVRDAVEVFFDKFLGEQGGLEISNLKKANCSKAVAAFAIPEKQDTQAKKPDEKPEETKKPTLDEMMAELPVNYQIGFMVIRAILTLLIFSVMFTYVSKNFIRPMLGEYQEPDVDEIIRKIQAEGPVTHTVERTL